MALPVINGFKLDRGAEMVLGMGLPVLLLLINELIQMIRKAESEDSIKYEQSKKLRKEEKKLTQVNVEEILQVKRQNQFGLKIIAFSLLVTSIMLFILSGITPSGKGVTLITGIVILFISIIPWLSSLKIKKEINRISAIK